MYEKISIDMQLPLAYVSETLIGELECLEPFGKAESETGVCREGYTGKGNENIGEKSECIKTSAFRYSVWNDRWRRMYFGDIEEFMETVDKEKLEE